MKPPAPSAEAPQVKALRCTSCAAPIELRAPDVTERVACSYCGSVLDARDPELAILQKFDRQVRYQPLIPLGRRGQVRGETMEAIGMQRRRVTVEGVNYEWSEYLLWNPYKGFRFLAEYNGHWNYIRTTKEQPKVKADSSGECCEYLGKTFRHFQTASASTVLVVGEFNWEVRVGETAKVTDFVCPPLILSREYLSSELTWSLGEYLSPESVWEAFKLPGHPRETTGVAPTQPWAYEERYQERKQLWPLACAAVFCLHVFFMLIVNAGTTAHSQHFTVSPGDVEKTKLTDVFELKGRTCDVSVRIGTNLQNSWAYFNMALINEETNVALDFGREVSFYDGHDSDGYWSEGDRNDECFLPSVPPGRYYLLMEPEPANVSVAWDVSIERDVTMHRHLFLALIVLCIPGFWLWYRRRSFEYQRWLESDHPMEPLVKFGGGDDDD
ncbi:MAG: DUF4178 domain-containing protein [Candidatus Wallbacteria bacterium]|nr:DUF4178 domain-containing protein [Candidatus Wallbacteria bacterium]